MEILVSATHPSLVRMLDVFEWVSIIAFYLDFFADVEAKQNRAHS
jgi:hypothetical protein